MLISAKRTPGENYASLTLLAEQQQTDPNWGYGILSVDDQDIDGNGLHIYVARGTRSIYYTCPNYFVFDGSMKLVFNFTAGENYVLKCDRQGNGSIHKVPAVGGRLHGDVYHSAVPRSGPA
ncbi:hypothetical protein GCM10010080_30560 [Thermomonas carbonis]|nr:hypothetical protein GCM10010080_30560 [Thermomonas carbonis]